MCQPRNRARLNLIDLLQHHCTPLRAEPDCHTAVLIVLNSINTPIELALWPQVVNVTYKDTPHQLFFQLSRKNQVFAAAAADVAVVDAAVVTFAAVAVANIICCCYRRRHFLTLAGSSQQKNSERASGGLSNVTLVCF